MGGKNSSLVIILVVFFAFVRFGYAQDYKIKSLTFVKHRPSQESLILSVLKKGATVTLLAERDGWIKIELANGSTGWIPATAVDKHTAVSAGQNQEQEKRTKTQQPAIQDTNREKATSEKVVQKVPTKRAQLDPVAEQKASQTGKEKSMPFFLDLPYIISLVLLAVLILVWRNARNISDGKIRDAVKQELKRQSEIFKTNVEEKQSYLVQQVADIEANIAAMDDRLSRRQERIDNQLKKFLTQDLPVALHQLKSSLEKILAEQGEHIIKLDERIQGQSQAVDQPHADLTVPGNRLDRTNDKVTRLAKPGKKSTTRLDDITIVKTDS